LQLLAQFIRSVQSGRAQFTQTVSSPPREGQAGRTRTSSGVFEFIRPNRFRFSYIKPYPQTLVADGQTLWLHDPELNQVTARKLSQVLQGTPAAVIASATDLRGLQADFDLRAQAPTDGLQWVLAIPRSRDGQLQSIRVGLRATAQGVELVTLDILDALGQRSLMQFSRFEVQQIPPASLFQFTPPPGADVIRQ
jgi:outer membrane lipoprotein carrier protein